MNTIANFSPATPAQRSWLRHMTRTGDVSRIPTTTFLALQRKGLVTRVGGTMYVLTAKGRDAIAR